MEWNSTNIFYLSHIFGIRDKIFECAVAHEKPKIHHQRLYNIRVFVINIQTSEYKYTYGDFVNDGLVYEGTNDGKEKVHENKNDKYFDLTDEDRLIPYGIIIVLMENVHFDTIFKLHGESSLIIPAGSQKVEFLLPYLQITPTL